MLIYGNQQIKISMHRVLYEELIPENNILRQMKENVNFSFVNKLLEDKYVKYYGRPAKEPELMFKLIFLQFKDDLSDREVIDRASYDLSYKYFLNLDPEDILPDASLLSVFRKTKISEEDTLEELLRETVRQAIEKGVLKSNTIIIDATHTESKSVTKSPTQLLQEITKKIRREIYTKAPEKASILPEKEGSGETLETLVEYTKKLIEAVENNTKNEEIAELVEAIEKAKKTLEDERINKKKVNIDEEAKKGYKSENQEFTGYKEHVAMSDERIITGMEITTGEAPDGKYLEELVRKTEENGMEVKEILADAAYSGKDNLEFAKEEGIELVSRLNPVISNAGDKNDGFEYNKDADTVVCPEGNLPDKKKEKKPSVDKKTGKYKNGSITYTYKEEKCQGCPRRNECLKKGKTRKVYTRTILSDVHKEQKEFQETEEFKTRAKERYKIEAKNGELKNEHGLDKCRYLGLTNMRIQAFVTAFVVNVKRINKLITTKNKEVYA